MYFDLVLSDIFLLFVNVNLCIDYLYYNFSPKRAAYFSMFLIVTIDFISNYDIKKFDENIFPILVE